MRLELRVSIMMGVVVTSHFMSNYNSIGFYDVIGNNLAQISQ
jgi:hypothetical protein